MKTNLKSLALLLFLFGCSDIEVTEASNNTADTTKTHYCNYLYSPVCGDDGVTYGNECIAKRSGIKNWTSGVCSY